MNWCERLVMLLTGSIIYFYFEVFVRGYSHISMFVLGGICFYTVGKNGEKIINSQKHIINGMILVMAFSALIITIAEFFTGVIVNMYMNLNVWDYSKMKFNLFGQICLSYSMLWALLGLPCVYIYGIIKRFVLSEN